MSFVLAAEPVVRPARQDDEQRLFGWRNDPFVIARTTTQRSVTLSEHTSWFRASLCDPNRRLSIVEIQDQPAGAVRFDRIDAENCVISIYLLQAFTGKGFGTRVIKKTSMEIIRDWAVNVIAYVREENSAAASSFKRARFSESAADERTPVGHRVFMLPKDHQEAVP